MWYSTSFGISEPGHQRTDYLVCEFANKHKLRPGEIQVVLQDDKWSHSVQVMYWSERGELADHL